MNPEYTINDLKFDCQDRGAKGLVIDLHGTAYGGKHPLNAALAVHLCSKTMLPTYIVSYEGVLPKDKENFLKRHRAQRVNVALSGSQWRDMICAVNNHNLYAVGVLDKCELEWTRPYEHFTLIADKLIFSDMRKSEIEELYKKEMDLTKPYEKEVWESRPAATDMIGKLDITYEELEWADKNNIRTHILVGGDPAKHNKWFRYTGRQKKVLSRIYEIERSTRYKISSLVRQGF